MSGGVEGLERVLKGFIRAFVVSQYDIFRSLGEEEQGSGGGGGGQKSDRFSVVVGDKREGWCCVLAGGAFCCHLLIHAPARASNVSV